MMPAIAINAALRQLVIADLSQGTGGAKASGASVIIHAHRVLCGILNDAVNDNLLARNPAKGVKLPRANRKRPVYLTHQQVTNLAAAAGEFEGLVLMLAYTGLRWGEVIGLRVRDLDMLRRRATISENAVQVNMTIHVGTTKAHKHRTVPLPEFLLPLPCPSVRRKGTR
jgi:integrase